MVSEGDGMAKRSEVTECEVMCDRDRMVYICDEMCMKVM